MTVKRLKLITIIIVYFFFTTRAQTSILENLNFDKGEWKLFGISIENEKNTLQDSLGHFFTNDKEILKTIQKTWKLTEHESFYACGAHYKFVFTQNDTFEYSLMLNLNCREICGDLGCFEFPESMLRQFYPKLKRIPKTNYTLRNLPKAQKLYQYLLEVDSVMITSENYQFWSKFPGVLTVTVIDSIVNSYIQIDTFVMNKIKADYPKETFEIDKGSSFHPPEGADTYIYYIYCSQGMGKGFKTYEIREGWQRFDKMTIVIFGLTKTQINKILKTIKR